MFKKLITLMMVFTISTAQAHASTVNGLKAAFDEMNYSLTVEWDQQDKIFYETELKKFIAAVRELQKSGLTNAEMIDFAKSQVKDAKVAKDLETAFSMVTINKMSSEEASEYLISTMKRTYSKGASWNGNAVVIIAAGLFIVAIAVVLSTINTGANTNNNDSDTGPYCFEECFRYEWFAPHEGDDYICTVTCKYPPVLF